MVSGASLLVLTSQTGVLPDFNTDINVAFKKGNKLAPGGKREGAGKPADWLREHTRGIIQKDKLIERLALIARGGDIPQPLNNGEVVPVPAPVAEQRKAILDLVERGYGKVIQGIEPIGETQILLVRSVEVQK